jgi:hypothetical protein
MSVVVVLEVVLVLVVMAVVVVLVLVVLVAMAVLDVRIVMAAVLDVLVVTGSTGLTNFMITTATVAPTATNPNDTRIPIIRNFLRDTGQPPIASFIPPRPPESSRRMGFPIPDIRRSVPIFPYIQFLCRIR